MDAWASPVAAVVSGKTFATPEALAAKYEELFQQALAEEGKTATDPGSRRCTISDGEVRAVPRARQMRGAITRQQYARAACADGRRGEDARSGDAGVSAGMGVTESDKIDDLPIHIRGSHWTLGEKVAAALPAA